MYELDNLSPVLILVLVDLWRRVNVIAQGPSGRKYPADECQVHEIGVQIQNSEKKAMPT